MPQLPILLGGVGLAALACVLQVVGVATPKWMFADGNVIAGLNTSVYTGLQASVDKDPNASVFAGLWTLCINLQGANICGSLDSVTDAMQAVRALSILAVLLLAGAAGVGALVAVRPSLFQFITLATAVAIAGEILAVIGIVIFMTKKWAMYIDVPVPQTLMVEFYFGYSVFLCIAAAVMGFFSMSIYIITRRRTSYTQLEP